MKTVVKIGIAVFICIGLAGYVGIHYRDSFIWRVGPTSANGSGTVFYDRWRAQHDFYNVINSYFNIKTCDVYTMDGSPVFRFPGGFCHFLKSGAFVTDMSDLAYFDPDGKMIWHLSRNIHHDLDISWDEKEIVLLGEKIMTVDNKPTLVDVVEGVGIDGRPNFYWDSGKVVDFFRQIAGKRPLIQWNKTHSENHKRDLWAMTHLNSVQVIPPNAMEDRIPAFRRGNILVNCFRLAVILILDRQTGKIVWTYHLPDDGRLWHGAHDVKVQPDGHLVYLLNINGSVEKDWYSSIEELDPLSGKTVWSYTGTPRSAFKISDNGSVSRLSNGNTLITHHTSGGSAFEVTPSGRIVWEWFNDNHEPDGKPTAIYRVERVEKRLVDRALKVWKVTF